MTDPTSAPPTDPSGGGNPPAPPVPPPAPPTPPAFDPTTLPADAQAYLTKVKADAEAQARIKAREDAKAEAAAAAREAVLKEFGQALGYVPKDGEGAPDVKVLQAEIDGLKGGTKADKREIALLRYGTGAGVSVGRLADSRSFMAKIDKLDPAADTFAADLAKLVDEAVTADPSLKGGPAAQPPGAGDFGTGTGAPPAPTGSDAEIEAMEKALGYRK